MKTCGVAGGGVESKSAYRPIDATSKHDGMADVSVVFTTSVVTGLQLVQSITELCSCGSGMESAILSLG